MYSISAFGRIWITSSGDEGGPRENQQTGRRTSTVAAHSRIYIISILTNLHALSMMWWMDQWMMLFLSPADGRPNEPLWHRMHDSFWQPAARSACRLSVWGHVVQFLATLYVIASLGSRKCGLWVFGGMPIWCLNCRLWKFSKCLVAFSTTERGLC